MDLKIIFTSDIHGCFFPYDFIHAKETTVSLSQVATYVNKLRKEDPDTVVLLDGGDILQGQPTCYLSNIHYYKETNLAARVYNYLNYDAVCLGNHDIETGHPVYDKWAREMDCPVLCANLIVKGTGETYFKPYTIIKKKGIRIAVLGLTTTAVPYWLSNRLWKGLEFSNPIESTQRWLEYLNENESPDFIIGLFHSGMSGGIDCGDYIENFTARVAEKVDGFDLILFGHDHKSFCGTITNDAGNDVVCVNPSSNSYCFGEIDINIEAHHYAETKGKKKRTKEIIYARLNDVSKFAVDKNFISLLQDDFNKIKKFIETPVGLLTEDVSTNESCFRCAPVDYLIHKVQQHVTGAQISFAAPLCFDEILRKGEVHVSDIFKLYQYENTICSLWLTGKEIKDYLEFCYDLWICTMHDSTDHIMQILSYRHNDKEYAFFKNLVFNFDTAYGIHYTVDATKECGKRIFISRLEDGSPFSLNEKYQVAMHSYRACGGNEFLTKGCGISHEELPSRIAFESKQSERYYIYKYIKQNGVLKAKRASNWHFVPEHLVDTALQRDKKLLFP